jgi:hypothetical protein
MLGGTVMSTKVFDFKKEYKDLYLPKEPMLVQVTPMNFIMVDGSGDPNQPGFTEAVELLYGLAYTIKMSKKSGMVIDGYFDYVVPPLEGLWWIEAGVFSMEQRENWKWTAMIRQPDFVTAEVFAWAKDQLAQKKPDLKVEKLYFETYDEGLCVQIMHVGPYATEPESLKKLEQFIAKEGLEDRTKMNGKHHEIYLSDPRKAKPEQMKTVLRHQVRRK